MRLKQHRESKKAEFEKAIVAAASEEFSVHGYDDVSLRRLAKKMGCAVGTLYLYFENKDALLHAVVEASFEILAQRMDALPRLSDSVETMKAGLRAYIEFGLEFPHHYRCAFSLPQSSIGKRYRPHRAFDFLQATVRVGAEQHAFRFKDVDALTQTIWAAAHGLTSLLITRPNFPWASREVLIQHLIEMVITGIAAPNSILIKGPKKTEARHRRK